MHRSLMKVTMKEIISHFFSAWQIFSQLKMLAADKKSRGKLWNLVTFASWFHRLKFPAVLLHGIWKACLWHWDRVKPQFRYSFYPVLLSQFVYCGQTNSTEIQFNCTSLSPRIIGVEIAIDPVKYAFIVITDWQMAISLGSELFKWYYLHISWEVDQNIRDKVQSDKTRIFNGFW